MKNISSLLAWRYIWATSQEKSVSTMVKICFIGIAVGTFALALVSAIMRGFEYTIHHKMQNIHPQLMIRSQGIELDADKINAVIKQEFPEIVSVSPIAMDYAIIKSADTDPTVVLIKAIDPLYETQVSALGKKVYGQDNIQLGLGDAVHGHSVLIGKTLAQNLDVTIGEPIEIFYTDLTEAKSKKLSLQSAPAQVGGLFETGIDEFDSGVLYCSFELFDSLFDNGITQLNLKLTCDANEQEIMKRLQDRLHIPVLSWKDLYPALVSALKLEKYAMFFILALITLVASMSIISLLFMQITQKRPDIAIMRAIGIPYRTLTRIFMLMGMGIALCATATGLILATAASWLLERYPFIQLPDAYYVSHLPAKMELSIIIAVFLTTIVLSFFATWLPTRMIRKMNISHILRFEG